MFDHGVEYGKGLAHAGSKSHSLNATRSGQREKVATESLDFRGMTWYFTNKPPLFSSRYKGGFEREWMICALAPRVDGTFAHGLVLPGIRFTRYLLAELTQ
jgi:hypothetical protein